jgi:hypothetical protein
LSAAKKNSTNIALVRRLYGRIITSCFASSSSFDSEQEDLLILLFGWREESGKGERNM